MRRPLLLLVLLVLIGVAAFTWRDAGQRMAVDRLCAAVEAGDWRHGLDVGPSLVGDDEHGLRAADCLALAHFGAQDPGAALAVLDRAIATSDTWMPRPLLAAAVLDAQRRRGRARAAAELARRATAVHPFDGRLAITELEIRLETEDAASVLDQMIERLERGPIPGLRAAVALHLAERGEIDRADTLLGDAPETLATPDVAAEWFRVRAAVDAMAGDATAVADTARRWVAAGGRSIEVMAWHALTLSLYQLDDPDFPVLPMLERAAEQRDELPPSIAMQVYRRLIGTLILAERHDDAIARLAEVEAVFGEQDLGVTRDDIERSREHRLAEQADPATLATTGRLRFVPPAAWRGSLVVSPELDAPADALWQDTAITNGESTTLDRTVGTAPQRWVLRDEEGTTRGSGTVWPSRGRTVDIAISARPASSRPSYELPPPAPGDGVSRVRALVLDCGDWRLLQYLRARDDLPVLDALLSAGRRAVVWSDPPFTAAAMDALVSPTEQPPVGVFASLQALGSELGSNPFLGGVDPLAGVGALVPSEPSLFAVVGSGDRQALNLLFSKGKVDAGRHGEVVGPSGQTRRWDAWSESRPLTDAERGSIPDASNASGLDGHWRIWFESTAAVLDAFDTAAASDLDLVLVRVAAFDSATHGGFARAAGGGQDDGAHRLYDLYRYIDARLAASVALLDADDVLVVLSDHGIRTAMEHDERSLFVAYGGGLAPGRVPGRPSLRGVPRVLAALVGVDAPWPWAGFEDGFPELVAEAAP
ncbi:MAG: hypothetical protein AAGE94_16910 [Acidobacteriota bacterium]